MRDRRRDWVRVRVLVLTFSLALLLPPICHAKIVNDTRRTKRDASVRASPRPEKNAREIPVAVVGPKRERKANENDYDETSYIKQEDRTAEKSASTDRDGRDSRDEPAEDADEETGAIRVRRDVDLDDQDEKSDLYDDYEAKEVAKRDVLGGPGDYAEAEEQEEEEEEEMESGEARVKREPPAASSDLSAIDQGGVVAAANEPRSREASREVAAESSAPRIERSEVQEPSAVADDANAEYSRHAEERIQRKIDTIKNEIQRDVEARRRVREIRENNARFDELMDQERENDDAVVLASSRIERQGTSLTRMDADRAESEGSLGKKRERARRTTVLVSDDRCRAKKTDASSPFEKESSEVMAPRLVGDDSESNEEEQSSDSMSPRLARDYREAFGGLQGESGSVLARFKRIKRVLGGPDAKV